MLIGLIRTLIFLACLCLYFKITCYFYPTFNEETISVFQEKIDRECFFQKWWIVLTIILSLSIVTTLFLLFYYEVVLVVIAIIVLIFFYLVNRSDERYKRLKVEITDILEKKVDEVVADYRIKENVKVNVLDDSRSSTDLIYSFDIESAFLYDEDSKEKFRFAITKKLRSERNKPKWINLDGESVFKFIIDDNDLDELNIIVAICINEETITVFERYYSSQKSMNKPIDVEDGDF